MGTPVDVATDITGMVFWIPWGRHDTNAAAIAPMVWTPQHTPEVCPRARFGHKPIFTLGIANRVMNMFIGVLSHGFSFSYGSLTTLYYTLRGDGWPQGREGIKHLVTDSLA